MLRMFARAQSGHVQTRIPARTAGDHESGGGTEGVGAWQVEQHAERKASFMSPGWHGRPSNGDPPRKLNVIC